MKLAWALMSGILVSTVLGGAHASTTEELLDELGSISSLEIIQLNDTTYILKVKPVCSLGYASCGVTFPGYCSVPACIKYTGNTCCKSDCSQCGAQEVMAPGKATKHNALCCKECGKTNKKNIMICGKIVKGRCIEA